MVSFVAGYCFAAQLPLRAVAFGLAAKVTQRSHEHLEKIDTGE